jgi:hypothetical protein
MRYAELDFLPRYDLLAFHPGTALLGTVVFGCVWGRDSHPVFSSITSPAAAGGPVTASFLFSPSPPSSVLIESPQRSNIPSSLLFFCVRGSRPVHYLSFLPSPVFPVLIVIEEEKVFEYLACAVILILLSFS